MLNICIVFAQLERETIQKRVTDAYYSRSQRGFKMGGKAPYGFHTEPIKMDGINTKKLVVNPDEAANIRLMFEMYAQPLSLIHISPDLIVTVFFSDLPVMTVSVSRTVSLSP